MCVWNSSHKFLILSCFSDVMNGSMSQSKLISFQVSGRNFAFLTTSREELFRISCRRSKRCEAVSSLVHIAPTTQQSDEHCAASRERFKSTTPPDLTRLFGGHYSTQVSANHVTCGIFCSTSINDSAKSGNDSVPRPL